MRKRREGIPWWPSRLRIWFCVTAVVPVLIPGTSTHCGHGQKKKRKKERNRRGKKKEYSALNKC